MDEPKNERAVPNKPGPSRDLSADAILRNV